MTLERLAVLVAEPNPEAKLQQVYMTELVRRSDIDGIKQLVTSRLTAFYAALLDWFHSKPKARRNPSAEWVYPHPMPAPVSKALMRHLAALYTPALYEQRSVIPAAHHALAGSRCGSEARCLRPCPETLAVIEAMADFFCPEVTDAHHGFLQDVRAVSKALDQRETKVDADLCFKYGIRGYSNEAVMINGMFLVHNLKLGRSKAEHYHNVIALDPFISVATKDEVAPIASLMVEKHDVYRVAVPAGSYGRPWFIREIVGKCLIDEKKQASFRELERLGEYGTGVSYVTADATYGELAPFQCMSLRDPYAWEWYMRAALYVSARGIINAIKEDLKPYLTPYYLRAIKAGNVRVHSDYKPRAYDPLKPYDFWSPTCIRIDHEKIISNEHISEGFQCLMMRYKIEKLGLVRFGNDPLLPNYKPVNWDEYTFPRGHLSNGPTNTVRENFGLPLISAPPKG